MVEVTVRHQALSSLRDLVYCGVVSVDLSAFLLGVFQRSSQESLRHWSRSDFGSLVFLGGAHGFCCGTFAQQALPSPVPLRVRVLWKAASFFVRGPLVGKAASLLLDASCRVC